jgi:hypothetical protein
MTMKMYGRPTHEDDEDFFGSNLGAGIEALDGARDEGSDEDDNDGFAMDEDIEGIMLSDTDGYDLHGKDDMDPAAASGDED